MSATDNKAVFLSYASQDAEAARRICEALRQDGVEVWFDQSELVGGDAWDAKIRGQIGACALFVPVISANTQARGEGYFRLEWKLAVDRSHLMAHDQPFLLPVVIDATKDGEARVPPEFRAVQWTRLAADQAWPSFCTRVRRLLGDQSDSEENPPDAKRTGDAPRRPALRKARGRQIAAVVSALIVLVALAIWQPWRAAAGSGADRPQVPVVAPGKSIAVLPFASLSADQDNEFFADGVHEDVITNLAKIRALKVIARPSVLAYRDPATRNLKQIATELGVATLLTGSVRRAGEQVLVTVQLIDPASGTQLWGDRYQENLTDLFAIQTGLAEKITQALQTNLTREERALISRRPTENSEAYELYLRAMALNRGDFVGKRFEEMIPLLEKSAALDPTFAEAYAGLAIAHTNLFWFGHLDPTPRRAELARGALAAAIRLAPALAETRLATGVVRYRVDLQFQEALEEFSRAWEDRPNDADLVTWLGLTHRRLGHWPDAVRYLTEAAVLDPRSPDAHVAHVETLLEMHRYAEAERLARRYLAIVPDAPRLSLFGALSAWEVEGDSARARARVVAGLDQTFGKHMPSGYFAALLAQDYAAADRALTQSEVAWIPDMMSVVNEPVVLHRSRLAFVRGDAGAAREFARQALEAYAGGKWTRRQESRVLLGQALAHALGGGPDEALALVQKAQSVAAELDAPERGHQRFEVGAIQVVLGRNDEAIAVLREMMSGYCRSSPQVIRHDPIWSRLNEDPRFEEILKSVKPL